MSTDDRSRVFTANCKCGQGKVFIDYCTPGHGFSVSVPIWYEARISCEVCKPKYQLGEQNGEVFYITIEEVLKKQALSSQAYRLQDLLLVSPPVMEAKNVVASILVKQPSKAAKSRLLAKYCLFSGSEQSFRRSWQGEDDFLKTLSIYSLSNLFLMAGFDISIIKPQLEEIENAHERSQLPCATAGSVGYKKYYKEVPLFFRDSVIYEN